MDGLIEQVIREQAQEIKETLLRALSTYRGDDLERARRSFDHLTASQMQEEFGQSGRTRQQILDEYQAHADRVARARDFVNRIGS